MASVETPALVRHWLAQLVPAGSREASTLAASEIVTNALMHGRLTPEQRIKVTVTTGGRVRVRISHPGEMLALVPAPAAGAGGGWGLRIVEAVTHAWGVEFDDHRSVVWFEV